MDFLTCLACTAIQASLFGTTSRQASTLTADTRGGTNIVKPTRSRSPRLPPTTQTGMPLTIKLLPYEILAGTATSYADVAITIFNPAAAPIVVRVNQIDIKVTGTQTVLLQSTPADLGPASQVRLKPGESQVVHVRLQTATKIYQPGQKVTAVVRYQRQEQPEQLAQSESEAVAFMIP